MEYYLRITSACNLDCIFCETRSLKFLFNFKSYIKLVYYLKQKGYDRLIITGGEPTLYINEISKISQFAKKIGFKSVCLQTNGYLLHDISFAKRVVGNDFDEIMISFHSHIPEDFDYIYNKKGSFLYVTNGIKNLCKLASGKIFINLVLNSVNSHYVEDTLQYIHEEFIGVNTVCITPINPILEEGKNILLLPFSELYQTISKVLNQNEKAYRFYLHSDYYGMPVCFFTPEHLKSIDVNERLDCNNHNYHQYEKVKQCNTCSYNEKCIGVNSLYVKRFGDHEITAI